MTKYLIAVFLLLCAPLFLPRQAALLAQCSSYTQVTGTVTDPDGIPYAYGKITATITPSGGGSPTCTGADGLQHPFANPVGPAQLDASGSFTMQLPPNSIITNGGSTWALSVSITGNLPPIGTGPQQFSVSIAIAGSSQSVSAALDAAAPVLSNISGGGGAHPAPPGNCVQFANASASALATASSGSTCLGVDSVSAPTKETVPFSEEMAGPIPWVDVTAYGADPTGTADSTSAIQAAITAACAQTHVATVFFPPGQYKAQQPQVPSTSPVFTGCAGLHLYGLGNGNGADQFGFSPKPRITVTAGAAPDAAPTFDTSSTWTFQNLEIDGVNQAVKVDGSFVDFDNTCLTSQVTGGTDNTPLEIDNELWVWFENHSCLDSFSATVPDAIYNADTAGQNMGLIYMNNVLMSGGGVEFLSGALTGSGVVGNFSFDHVTLENCGGDFFNASGSVALTLSAINLNQVAMSDCSGNGALVNLNIASSRLYGLTIHDSQAAGGNAVVVTQGELGYDSLNTCNACSNGVSGGPALTSLLQGWYATTNGSGYGLTNTPLYDGGTAFQARVQGDPYSLLALDPTDGLLLGQNNSDGYTAGIDQTSEDSEDATFAGTLPPTNVTGTPTTGGTLAAGTYYYWVRSVQTGATCTGGSTAISTVSLASAAVVVSSPNDAVTVAWTAPVAGPYTTPNYCVLRYGSSTPGNWGAASYSSTVITGTTFTDTGSSMSCCGYAQPNAAHFYSTHRFVWDGLGVNTLSPAYDLDVAHPSGSSLLPGIRADGINDTALAASLNCVGTDASKNLVAGTCSGGGLPSGGVLNQLVCNSGTAGSGQWCSPTMPSMNGGSAISLASASYTIQCDSSTPATGLLDRGGWGWVGTGGSNDLIIPDLSGAGCTGMTGQVGNQSGGSITVSRQTSDTFTIYGPNAGAPLTAQTSFTLPNGQWFTFSPDGSTDYAIRIYGPAGSVPTGTFQTNGSNNTTSTSQNFITSTVNAVGLTATPSNPGTNQEKIEITGTYTGSLASGTGLTASQLPAGIFSCSEVWSGSGTSSALQSGDDAISNNTCYNDSGSTRTITKVICRSDAASNTTTVNPTFGSAGTGTSILSGALTCGSSYAYSSGGTISTSAWTTGTGIDPGMGGTLTGTSIALKIEYHY